MPQNDKLLLASIHDVSPRFESEVDELADRIERLIGSKRFAMLVVPDHWGEAPLRDHPSFQAKLRAWADAGVEMFVHGWYHRDHSRHRTGLSQFKARHMTAGEGEFLGLDADEAYRRMIEGRKLIEDVIGRRVAGFIAPAWLYGEGALEALNRASFAIAEDHMKVWQPNGAILTRGPVITWASRSKGRIASSIAFATLARAALHVLPIVRIAVHPGDSHVPPLLRSIDSTIRSFARNRVAGRYGDLVPIPGDATE